MAQGWARESTDKKVKYGDIKICFKVVFYYMLFFDPLNP